MFMEMDQEDREDMVEDCQKMCGGCERDGKAEDCMMCHACGCADALVQCEMGATGGSCDKAMECEDDGTYAKMVHMGHAMMACDACDECDSMETCQEPCEMCMNMACEVAEGMCHDSEGMAMEACEMA